MKRLYILTVLFFLIFTAVAQEITVYGFLPSEPDPDFLRLGHLDPLTGEIINEDSIYPAIAYALGSSSFDAVNNAMMFIGLDTAFHYRLYTRGIRSQTIYDPMIYGTINDLQYDMNSTNTYGLGSYVVDSTLLDSVMDIWIYDYGLRFLSIDQEEGTITELKKMPDFAAFPVGSSTFDANNGRYIINAYDTAFTERLVIIDAENGDIISKEPLELNPGDYLNNLEYNNEDNKIYGFYRGGNLTYFSLISIDINDDYAIDTIYAFNDLLYFMQGAAVFHQETQYYIMFYIDEDNVSRIAVIDVTSGELVANPEFTGTLSELEVDNTEYALEKYHETVAVNEIRSPDRVSVYPNPVQRGKSLTYNLDFAPDKLHVFDLSGRQWEQINLPGAAHGNFKLGDLPPALYILTFEGKDRTISYKVRIW
ncbi:MAG: T9SS type A sorting domain-containing protein [bacterium]|jgi:hypothetical protein